MPAAVLIPILQAAIPAAATIGAQVYLANKTSDTQRQAAQLQTQGTQASLDFQKQQAEAAYTANEATRKANYDQWAATANSANKTRASLGLPTVDVPAYAPQPDPGLNGQPAPAGPSAGQALGGTPPPSAPSSTSGNPTDRNYILQQLQQLYAAHGVTPTGRGSGPTDIQYYADQIASTGGWQGGNAGYWTTRIAQDLGKSGSAPNPSATAATTRTPVQSAGGYLGSPNVTPALSMPAPVDYNSLLALMSSGGRPPGYPMAPASVGDALNAGGGYA